MRKLILVGLIALIAICVPKRAPAQDIGGSLYYDFQTRDFTPVVSTKIAELPNFLGVRNLTPQIRGFVGVSNARGLAGTALVFARPIASNATAELGIGARALTGQKVGLGIFAGISIKL